MEDQKHYIMVENEAYEMYDGNGSFYVTKANYPLDLSTKTTFSELEDTSVNSFMDTILPLPKPVAVPIPKPHVTLVPPIMSIQKQTSLSDLMPMPASERAAQSTPSHLEPILIDNYSNMNYFTQAASDVTIYINSDNQNNFMQSDRPHHSSNVTETLNASDLNISSDNILDIPEVESTIDLNEAIQCTSRDELDEPEFIDISNLNITYIEQYGGIELQSSKLFKKESSKIHQSNIETFHTNKRKINDKDSDDDDVIFVKEFQANDTDVKTSKIRETTSNPHQENVSVPRRNPKRRVQMIKESFDLSLKLSDEEIYCGNSSKGYKEDTSRRSTRSISAPKPSTSFAKEDYKEWPKEGLHERPVFNMDTKKIEKFDFKACQDKPTVPPKKPVVSKAVKSKKPAKKNNKKKTPNKTSNKKQIQEKGISEEFAAMTHDTLQTVMNYVIQVKEFNELRKKQSSASTPNTQSAKLVEGGNNGKTSDNVPHPDTGNVIDDANSLLDLVRSDTMKENLGDAVDLLTDSCILYSIANDVCQQSVATYLNSVKKK